jgi:hypothetical protein
LIASVTPALTAAVVADILFAALVVFLIFGRQMARRSACAPGRRTRSWSGAASSAT